MNLSSTWCIPFFCIFTQQLISVIYGETFNSKSSCVLHNPNNANPVHYSSDGDITIGGILQINAMLAGEAPTYSERPSVPFCAMPSFQHLVHFLAFIYAIDEINNSTDILPNITLGFQIYDVCDSELMAIKGTLNVLSETKSLIPNYSCKKTAKLAAFIGHLLSSPTYAMAHISQLYGYPQVTYAALDLSFNNLDNFPYIYQTIPNESHQFKVIIELLLHFQWKWVGIIASNDLVSVQSSEHLKRQMSLYNICTEFHLVLHDIEKYSIRIANKTITMSTVNVIILYVSSYDLITLSQCTDFQALFEKVWIFPASMNVLNEKSLHLFFNPFNGSLLISMHNSEIPGFKNYLSEVSSLKNNVFLLTFAEIFLGCPENSSELDGLSCVGTVSWKDLLLKAEYSTYSIVHAIHSALYLIAKALHEMYMDLKTYNASSLHSSVTKQKLNYFLKHIYQQSHSRKKSFSSEQSDVIGSYDIMNWVIYSENDVKISHIGSFLESSQELLFNDTAFTWNKYFDQVPKSLCSDECVSGYHRIPRTGKPNCCFDCVPCPDGEITNTSDPGVCEKCPEYQWPNLSKEFCINKTIDFLSYEGLLGISLSTLTISFSVLTIGVLWVFIKYRNTPIVKANNLNLSYTLLVSLVFSFLCCFLFIGLPTHITCLIRHAIFGTIFSLALSSVLGKTVTVVIAFNATKPRSRLRYWIGPKTSIGLMMVCSLGELVLSVFCLIYSPPYVEFDKAVKDKLIPQCNEGSVSIFYLSGFYLGGLATSCFLVAFPSRKLPDRFNEAQYITFSMLVFCSVWVSFIPTYLSTKGKYMVAVEIFAILSSTAGLLLCIFMPKCYLVILKPEVNIKKSYCINTQVSEGKRKHRHISS